MKRVNRFQSGCRRSRPSQRERGCAEWAAAARVPYLDLVDTEARYRSPELRIDDIHRSAFGHEVDAIAIFDWLVDDHVVPYGAIRARPTAPAPDYPAVSRLEEAERLVER